MSCVGGTVYQVLAYQKVSKNTSAQSHPLVVCMTLVVGCGYWSRRQYVCFGTSHSPPISTQWTCPALESQTQNWHRTFFLDKAKSRHHARTLRIKQIGGSLLVAWPVPGIILYRTLIPVLHCRPSRSPGAQSLVLCPPLDRILVSIVLLIEN